MSEAQEKAANLSRILNKSHENKWVAIAHDYSRILAAAESLTELARSVKDSKAIYHRVLPSGMTFAPASLRCEI